MKIAYCKTAFVCYDVPMTTNELIELIRANHNNLDDLAQIASAVEAMQEALHDDGEPSDDGADAEWLASAGWGNDEDYE